MKLVFSPSVCGDLGALLANMQITVFLLNFFPSSKTAIAWQKYIIVIVAQPACRALVCFRLYVCQPKLYSGTACFQLLPKFHFPETRGCFWGAVPPPLLQQDCLPLGCARLGAHPPRCPEEPALGPRLQNWRCWLPSLRASFSSFGLRWWLKFISLNWAGTDEIYSDI